MLLLSFIEHKVKRNEQRNLSVFRQGTIEQLLNERTCFRGLRCRCCLHSLSVHLIGSLRLSYKSKLFHQISLSLIFCYEYYCFLFWSELRDFDGIVEQLCTRIHCSTFIEPLLLGDEWSSSYSHQSIQFQSTLIHRDRRRRSEYVDGLRPNSHSRKSTLCSDLYVITPPIEHFLRVSSRLCREQFFKVVLFVFSVAAFSLFCCSWFVLVIYWSVMSWRPVLVICWYVCYASTMDIDGQSMNWNWL